MSFAEVKNINGSPALVIDGKTFPPMAMTVRFNKPDYIRHLGEAGLRVFFLMTNTDWLRPGKDYTDENGVPCHEPSGLEAFVKNAEVLLSQVPDAYIIVRIGLHPPVDWMEENPDELITYQDGSHEPSILSSEVHKDEIPGMYSFASDKWKAAAGKAVKEFCDAIDRLPFADRVIGYFLAAGGTSEWYPVNAICDRAKNKYGDFSPAFLKSYGNFLRKRYGTEEKLRRAWKREGASFDAPVIPNVEEQYHIHMEEGVLDAMKYYESAERIIGKNIDINARKPTNLGVFLNMEDYAYVADFYDALHEATAEAIVHFAALLKARYTGKVVGAFYGSYGCTDFYNSTTATVHSNVWLENVLAPAYMTPGFYIDDPGAHILGTYCELGLPAYAIREMDGWTSVYCAPQILRSELIASLAQYAGCHLYNTQDDVIYANANFVTIHASYKGKHTIRFKEACSPYEVYQKRYYGHNITELAIDMRLGDTLMFSLQGEC